MSDLIAREFGTTHLKVALAKTLRHGSKGERDLLVVLAAEGLVLVAAERRSTLTSVLRIGISQPSESISCTSLDGAIDVCLAWPRARGLAAVPVARRDASRRGAVALLDAVGSVGKDNGDEEKGAEQEEGQTTHRVLCTGDCVQKNVGVRARVGGVGEGDVSEMSRAVLLKPKLSGTSLTE